MSTSKAAPRGYVVEHKESGVRYAVSPQNLNPKIHDMIRDLKQEETVRGFAPRLKEVANTAAPSDVAKPTTEPEATQKPTK
jgi:hypothetical protein